MKTEEQSRSIQYEKAGGGCEFFAVIVGKEQDDRAPTARRRAAAALVNMMDDDEDMVDFGQKVDLCQSIKGVLTNYPEGALL